MNRAVFLDRDGVINKEIGDYIRSWSEFEFNPGAAQALKQLQDAGYLLIVITNQGGVEKGLYTLETAEEILSNMCEELAKEGVEITEYYFSPHHSNHSNSLDRKPGSIMIEKGLARFNIDPKQSFLIGDSERDIEAAERVGVQGIKIDSNDNLLDIVSTILG